MSASFPAIRIGICGAEDATASAKRPRGIGLAVTHLQRDFPARPSCRILRKIAHLSPVVAIDRADRGRRGGRRHRLGRLGGRAGMLGEGLG